MFIKAQSTETELPLLRDPARLDIQSILCPVDFSEFSFRALTYAASIARHFRSRLFVQHTVPVAPEAYIREIDEEATRESLQSELVKAGVGLGPLAAIRGPDPLEVHLLVNGGSVPSRILEGIEKHNIDLLVMGTHGHKGFSRLVLGSVTERMVHQATCPVLTVCHPERDFVPSGEPESIRLKTILLATDFSPYSDRALEYALKWSTEWSAKLILFHAVVELPPETQGRVDLFPELNPQFEKQIVEAWEKIQHYVPAEARDRCETSCEVRHGNAREEILRMAEQSGADLIVMGSRGLGLARTTWGSTISGVVRDGRFPVLAIRHLHETQE
jgi:nucleotide-binding universal stress UspA family protein